MAAGGVSFAPRMPSLSLRTEQKQISGPNARPKISGSDFQQIAGFAPCTRKARHLSPPRRISPAVGFGAQEGTRDALLLKRSPLLHNAEPFWECQRPVGYGEGRPHSFRFQGTIESPRVTRPAVSADSLQTLPLVYEISKVQSKGDTGLFIDKPLEQKDSWKDALTPGGRFESPRHLAELALPEATKRFIRVLRNPYVEGGLVYLIGTAHVSKASAEDVRLLIEAVKPDVVAVELDKKGLELVESDLKAAAHNVPFCTTWEALNVVRRLNPGDFGKFWSTHHPRFESQALGVTFGCDARAAIETARRLGPHIEPIDQSIAAIASRLDEFDLAGPQERPKSKVNKIENVSRSVAAMLQVLKDLLKAFDGNDANTEAAALARISAAFLRGQPAPLVDISAFQSLKNKAVEATRLQCFTGESLRAFEAREGSRVCDAWLHERDRFMGLKLAALASIRMKTVAVVGAAHVPGITARFAQFTADFCDPFHEGWEERLEEEARRHKERESHVQATTDEDLPDLYDVDFLCRGVAFTGAAAVGGLAWHQWPMLVTELGLGAFLVHGVLLLGLAAVTAKWAQFGAYLEAGSVALEEKRYYENLQREIKRTKRTQR